MEEALSIETGPIKVISDVYIAKETHNGQFLGIILLDLVAAFHKADHFLPLDKLFFTFFQDTKLLTH